LIEKNIPTVLLDSLVMKVDQVNYAYLSLYF